MSKEIAVAGLAVSVLSACTMLVLSRPVDQVFWLAAIWVLGAAASLFAGFTQVTRHRRLGWFCILGGAVMLFFAAMLLPAFQRAKGYRQQTAVHAKHPPPNTANALEAESGTAAQS